MFSENEHFFVLFLTHKKTVLPSVHMRQNTLWDSRWPASHQGLKFLRFGWQTHSAVTARCFLLLLGVQPKIAILKFKEEAGEIVYKQKRKTCQLKWTVEPWRKQDAIPYREQIFPFSPLKPRSWPRPGLECCSTEQVKATPGYALLPLALAAMLNEDDPFGRLSGTLLVLGVDDLSVSPPLTPRPNFWTNVPLRALFVLLWCALGRVPNFVSIVGCRRLIFERGKPCWECWKATTLIVVFSDGGELELEKFVLFVCGRLVSKCFSRCSTSFSWR